MDNSDKYGSKYKDIISEAYEHSKEAGDAFCVFNAKKYLKRYISDSEKSNNEEDLDKAIDYISRMKRTLHVNPEEDLAGWDKKGFRMKREGIL